MDQSINNVQIRITSARITSITFDMAEPDELPNLTVLT